MVVQDDSGSDRPEKQHKMDSTHDKVLRAEVMLASLEKRLDGAFEDVNRRIDGTQKLIMWVMGLMGLVSAGVLTAILTRAI